MSLPTVSAARTAELLGPLAGDGPAYRSLSDGLRLLVADGRIPAGTRLPSERDLTGALGMSRTTVTRAYAVLRESGYLTSRVGSGSVAALPASSARRGTGAALFPAQVGEDDIDLTCAATRAPTGVLAAYEDAVQRLPGYLAGAGYHLLGLPELREVIAARYAARGLPTTPEEVMITSGAVAGLCVAARALVRSGERVVMESPTYPNSVEALRRAGARLVPVPVEPTGWDVPSGVSTIRATRAAAAVLIPDFHNPTGSLMSDEARAEVGAALRRAGTVPLVDETVVEIALEDGPRPLPFAVHAPDTVTVGSSSKSHWGGLRTGWLRAPRRVMDALVESRATVDLGAPVLEQLVLLQLMRDEPGLGADRRADLVASRDALAGALRSRLPDIRFDVPPGGLSLWLQLPEANATSVVLAAEDEGLLLASGPRFAVTHGLERRLRFPYVLPVPHLLDAVERLARAVAAVSERPPSAAQRRAPGPRRPLVA